MRSNSAYSGNIADPRWESSSSSIVKPLQLTCGEKGGQRKKKEPAEASVWIEIISVIFDLQQINWEEVLV